MKHLVVDARMVRHSGIGRFLRQLLDGLIQDDRFQLTLLGEPDLLTDYAHADGRVAVVACHAPLYSIREQIRLPACIPRCDLLYVPHYVVPLLYRRPLVVAVNDLVHLERRDFAPSAIARLYARAMITTAVRRARRVVTLSEYSRDRLMQLTGAGQEHFEVVYPAVASVFFQVVDAAQQVAVRAQYGIQQPYLLFVGNAKRHKNLSTLLRALASLRRRGLEYQLVLVGQFSGIRSNVSDLSRLVADLQLSNRVRLLGTIPDEQLAAIYTGADLFVFPSLAEGFGLPPLEAMACGTPVLAARASAIPEVCGDAVEYYATPEDPECLAEAALAVGGDPDRRAQLRSLGRKRAQRFAGSASTRQLLELLYRA